MKATQVPTNRCRMDKEDMCVYIHNGILLSYKKEWNLAICNNTIDPEGIMLIEISQTEKDKILCDFMYMNPKIKHE